MRTIRGLDPVAQGLRLSLVVMSAFALGACLGADDESESAVGAASPAELTKGRSATRVLVDSQRTAEARDVDGDGVDDPPEYDVHWDASEQTVASYEQLYGSIRRVTVVVDVDYPRADAVGIWLKAGDHEVQLRAPEYYTQSQSAYRQTFTTTELAGDRAFAVTRLRIAGTELAVARDCYSDVSTSSASASASNRGVFRSSSYSVSESRSWTTRRCQEFFRPLSVKSVRITVEYDVPPVAMPTYYWDLGLNTAYTNDTKWFEVNVDSSVPPPYVMSTIDVHMSIWLPPSMGSLSVVLVGPAESQYARPKRAEIWSSARQTAERDDYIRIDQRVYDFDERRMDGTWRLELVHQGDVPPGTTYELKEAQLVFNPTTRPPVSWRSTPVDVGSPHPYFVNTTQSFDVVAPADAIACKLSFDRVEFAPWTASLAVRSPEGATLEEVYPPESGSSTVTPALPGNRFVLRFETKPGGQPGWGFHLDGLICKY